MSPPPPPFLGWDAPTTLGEVKPHQLLVRGFLPLGEEHERGFGYYVYLVFQPEASERQKLITAAAFLAHPEAINYQRLSPNAERDDLTLLVTPIKHNYQPQTAEELVRDYDSVWSAVITRQAAKVGLRLPPVALVGHRWPLGTGAGPRREDLLVGDACGDADEVNTKFRQLREGLMSGKVYKEGALVRFATTLGRILTRFTTEPCL